MAGPDAKDFFDLIKIYIVNIALCLFLFIGATKLIIEELNSLVAAYLKLKELLKK